MSSPHPSQSPSLPAAFAQIVSDGIAGILRHQRPDGAIVYDPAAPIVYPQQAIMPLAFAYAGLTGEPSHHQSPELLQCIARLGDFLTGFFQEDGRVRFDSYGNDVHTVDQRLAYAWIEALRILREQNADLPYDKWAAKLLPACDHLVKDRLTKLVGLRRFIANVMGTSTNHVALYVSTVYRAGKVFNRPELCEFVLPIGRALAADIHPDGYWEEHGDLLRRGGPTPSYNYLTLGGIALLHEWTGEKIFADAVAKATAFHGNFCHPDGAFLELIDERVRHDPVPRPRVWGLFAFSHTPEGRGIAAAHFSTWRKHADLATLSPETMARHCENALYWHAGPTAPAPFQSRNRSAKLTLPAAIFAKSGWSVGLSAIAATNPEDPAYRDNPFGLDRQKLLSVWHESAGLILDGSHSKNQPENSTFRATASYAPDYYPAAGSITDDADAWTAHAAYKTFFADVRARVISDRELEITLTIDPAGNRGPFTAGFTLARLAEKLTGLSGRTVDLASDQFAATGQDLGGGFTYANITLKGPPALQVAWPFEPFNCYAADRKSKPTAWQLRVETQLTPESPTARFTLHING